MGHSTPELPTKLQSIQCQKRSTAVNFLIFNETISHTSFTFCTHCRWILPESVRTIVLDCCLHDHRKKFDLEFAVVMPDHVHLILTPLIDHEEMELYSLAEITNAIKGSSAHKVNHVMNRSGQVWQAESFDHIVRSSESLDQKIEYLWENPIRHRLTQDWQNYPWLWQKPVENHNHQPPLLTLELK